MFYIFSFFILFVQQSFSFQVIPPTKKDTTKNQSIIFSLAAGLVYSSLNFYKNDQVYTFSRGVDLRAMAQFNETFRLVAHVSQVESNIAPSWININCTCFDLDGHMIAHFFDNKSTAYLILGVSAQSWKGYYTGIQDFNSWKLNLPPNTNYQTLYLGVSAGMGVEIKIKGPLSVYGELRFRFSKTDVGTGLNDVLPGVGLKLNILNSDKLHSPLKFRDKYHWF